MKLLKLLHQAHNAFIEIVEMCSGCFSQLYIYPRRSSYNRHTFYFGILKVRKNMLERLRYLDFILFDQLERSVAFLIKQRFNFLQLLSSANIFQVLDSGDYKKSLPMIIDPPDHIRVFSAVKNIGDFNQVACAFLYFFKLRMGGSPHFQQIATKVQTHKFLMATFLTIIRFAHRLNRHICGKDSKSAPDDGLKVVHPLRPPISRAVTENNRWEDRHSDCHRKKSEHPVIHLCPVVSPRHYYRQFDRNFQVGLNKRGSNNV